MIEPDYDAVAKARHAALVQSFVQTWREAFDSPLSAEIFNRAFADDVCQVFYTNALAAWESEGGR